MVRLSAKLICALLSILCCSLATHAQTCSELVYEELQCTGNGQTCYLWYQACAGTLGPTMCYLLNPVYCTCNSQEGAITATGNPCGDGVPEAGDVTSGPTVAQIFMRNPFGKWYPVNYVMFKRDGEHGNCPASTVLSQSRNRRPSANPVKPGGGL